MDSRISIVKGLGLGGAKSQKKRRYSEVQPHIDAMVEDARDHMYLGNQLYKIQNRYASPELFKDPIDETIQIYPAQVSDEKLRWCCSQVLRLHRFCSKSAELKHGGIAVVFRQLGCDASSTSSQAWVVVNNFKCTESLGQVHFPGDLSYDSVVNFVKPLGLLQSFDVFSGFYEATGPDRHRDKG